MMLNKNNFYKHVFFLNCLLLYLEMWLMDFQFFNGHPVDLGIYLDYPSKYIPQLLIFSKYFFLPTSSLK